MFGLCATALVTDVIQLATGYHAPFFLTVCKPNYTLLGTPCDANPYITQDICSGTDKHAILSARYVPGEPCATLPALLSLPNHVPSPCRKTFPSQHATLSAFAAVYISVSSQHCLAHASLGQHDSYAMGSRVPLLLAQTSSAQYSCACAQCVCKQLQSHMHPTALHGQAMTNSLFLPQMYFNSIISDSTKLLKPILVFAFAIAAGICGLTQITQYRSHPADVYVGFLIGAGIAAYLVGAGPALGPGRVLGDAGGAL